MPGSQDFAADPRNADALIYLNGALVPRDRRRYRSSTAASSSATACGKACACTKGRCSFSSKHLDRLYWGAKRIRLDIGLDRERSTREIRRTLEANGMHDGVHLRVMVTRGEKSRRRIRIRAMRSGGPTIVDRGRVQGCPTRDSLTAG